MRSCLGRGREQAGSHDAVWPCQQRGQQRGQQGGRREQALAGRAGGLDRERSVSPAGVFARRRLCQLVLVPVGYVTCWCLVARGAALASQALKRLSGPSLRKGLEERAYGEDLRKELIERACGESRRCQARSKQQPSRRMWRSTGHVIVMTAAGAGGNQLPSAAVMMWYLSISSSWLSLLAGSSGMQSTGQTC